MTTLNSNPRPPEPLTPEERTLAARLAQLGPYGTPPPAVDARIIAAAHAAAVGEARPRQGRWPALLGLAATLALAIGVTWQMQPGGEATSRDEALRERASTIAPEAAVDSAQPTAAPAAQQKSPADDAARSGDDAIPMRMPGPAAAEPDQPPAAVSGRGKQAASAMPASPRPLPQPTPPAAPPVAEPAIDAATPAQAQRETTMARRIPESRAESNAASAPMDPAMPAASAPAVAGGDLAAVAVARDSELAPAAWLERIRLRRDAGDLAGARESLQLLRRTHPEVVLPEDLRELADAHLDQP